MCVHGHSFCSVRFYLRTTVPWSRCRSVAVCWATVPRHVGLGRECLSLLLSLAHNKLATRTGSRQHACDGQCCGSPPDVQRQHQGEWDVFAEQLSYYSVANGIDDPDKRRAILLSACGASTYKLLKTLVAPAEFTTKSFTELVQLAKEHYTSKPSVIMCHFKFNSAFREEGESISAFVTHLRGISRPPVSMESQPQS